jgi:uncharacterized protein (DUF58 family)
MDYGLESQHKFRYAQRLAAALGHLALAAGDRLTLTVLPDSGADHVFGPARGRGHSLRLLKFLEALTPAGQTELDPALRRYALAAKRPGLVFLITDLFSPDGWRDGLAQLQSRGYEVTLLHLLAPDELDPPLAGDLRLIDSETHGAQDVTLDGGLRELYRRRVGAWRDEIEAYCLRRGIHCVPVMTDVPWEQLVLYHLRRRGLIK